MELMGLMAKLKMEHRPGSVDALCEQAAKRDLDYRRFLAEALATEWAGRHQKGLESRLKQARLPWIKTLEQFDFGFQPAIDRKVIRELAGLAFVERAENLILLGPPGVGKTQVSISRGADHGKWQVPSGCLDEVIAGLDGRNRPDAEGQDDGECGGAAGSAPLLLRDTAGLRTGLLRPRDAGKPVPTR